MSNPATTPTSKTARTPDLNELAKRFAAIAPKAGFCSLRFVDETSERLSVRQGVVQPPVNSRDVGAMLTVVDEGGWGYAATSDLSEKGLAAALERARHWAKTSRGRLVPGLDSVHLPHTSGRYTTPVEKPWAGLSLAAKLDLLRAQATRLKKSERIVDWEAMLWRVHVEGLTLTNAGGRVEQSIEILAPNLVAVANQGSETQSRSLGMFGESGQGGLEVLDRIGFDGRADIIAEEALELLAAPNCPSGSMDLLLAPDQMMLQIHESIGHPLELDRILGDERNYAGTSFVTLDMLGKYRYGSDLLNVTFDPSRPTQMASYGFDDDGVKGDKTFLIEKGILKRPLGSIVSRSRAKADANLAGAEGIANARATSWNRPPIDRMANLNVEAGTSSFDSMLGSIERGVYMRTNCSWSIDDSRNKFQFGCEWARLIDKGKLGPVVKKPNYRGISATFWRNLKAVGDPSTFEVLGTPFCGKGEPNQIIRVGHASPACVFSNVDVFGGE